VVLDAVEITFYVVGDDFLAILFKKWRLAKTKRCDVMPHKTLHPKSVDSYPRINEALPTIGLTGIRCAEIKETHQMEMLFCKELPTSLQSRDCCLVSANREMNYLTWLSLLLGIPMKTSLIAIVTTLTTISSSISIRTMKI
jgi:hypothetical protein